MNTVRHWTQSRLWKRTAVSALFGLSLCGYSDSVWAVEPGTWANQGVPSDGNYWKSSEARRGQIQPVNMNTWDPQAAAQPATPPAPAGEPEKKEEEAAPEEDKGFQLGDWVFGSSAKDAADNGWKVGGSTVQSWVGNFSSPSDRFNGPVTWTDRSNDYQLNQQWLYIERATDTSKCDWDLGMRVDLNYGTNYRWMTSAGFEDTWGMNTNHSFYGLALPQMYVETAYKKLKVKWGHYGSPVGYFVVDTTQNFFFTLPYTYQYGEPFTHWGFLSTYSVDDHLAVGGGLTRGWDNFNGDGTGSKNAGGVFTATYTWDDKSSLAWVGLFSNELANLQSLDEYSTRYFQTLVYTKPVNDKLTYVFQSDFGVQGSTTAADGRDIGTALWYGVNQYLLYKQTDQVTWGFNFEWFRDDGGFRVGGVLPTASDPNSQVRGLPLDRFGYDGSFFQITMGPKWQPTPNLFIRPNVRFDWFSGDVHNTGGLKPYDAGDSNFQCIAGADLGLTY